MERKKGRCCAGQYFIAPPTMELCPQHHCTSPVAVDNVKENRENSQDDSSSGLCKASDDENEEKPRTPSPVSVDKLKEKGGSSHSRCIFLIKNS